MFEFISFIPCKSCEKSSIRYEAFCHLHQDFLGKLDAAFLSLKTRLMFIKLKNSKFACNKL